MSIRLSHIFKWIAQFPLVVWILGRLRDLAIGALSQGPVPQHVAFVMDGNRRFARQNHIETVEGHNLGFEALAKILEVCYKSGVRVVTIYAFSIENFSRTKYEVDHLMEMAKLKLTQLLQHDALLEAYGAKVQVLGKRELIKPDVLKVVEKAEKKTAGNKRAVLNICFPYTSREEITAAICGTVKDFTQPNVPVKRNFSESHIARNIRVQNLTSSQDEKQSLDASRSSSPGPAVEGSMSAAESSTLNTNSMTSLDATTAQTDRRPTSPSFPDPEQITAQTITSHLYTHDAPPLDLLVRTSGVERLSDFLLWQCHETTKIKFVKCMWPEFDLWHFLPVLMEWQWHKQRENRNRSAWPALRPRRKTKAA